MAILARIILIQQFLPKIIRDSSRPPTIFESLAVIEIARLFDLRGVGVGGILCEGKTTVGGLIGTRTLQE